MDTRKGKGEVGARVELAALVAAMQLKTHWKPRGLVDAKLRIAVDGNGWSEVGGSVSVTQGVLQPPQGEELRDVSAAGEVKVTREAVEFTEVALKLGSTEVTGSLRLGASPDQIGDGTPYEFRGSVTTSDWKRVAQLLGGKPPLRSGRLSVRFATQEKLPRLAERVTGRFDLNRARLAVAGRELTVQSAGGGFTRNGEALQLHDVRARLGELTATVSATVSGLAGGAPKFRASVALNEASVASLARQFSATKIPVRHGVCTLHAEAVRRIRRTGSAAAGVTSLTGDARLSNVKLSSPPLQISTASATFRQQSAGYAITNLRVAAPEFTGSGAANVNASGGFTASGILSVRDRSGLKRLEPALANLRKGSGTVTLRASGRLDALDRLNMSGAAVANNGEWGIPGGAYGINRLEFTRAKGQFALSGGAASVKDLVVDGKDFNATGAGGMAAGGALHGSGSAKVMRSLALRVIEDAASQKMMKEIEKVPLEFIPMRLKLGGTTKEPRIGWSVDEKPLRQLALKAALKNTRVQRELDRVLGRLGKDSTSSGDDGRKTDPKAAPTKDELKKKAVDQLLKGVLRELSNKKAGQ